MSCFRVEFGLRLGTGGKEVNFQGLPGAGQGLEGMGQEVVLEVPLGGSHQTIDLFRVQLDSHFVHQADNAGEFPAGLEEQFEIPAGFGAPDDTQDHFHDDIEFTVYPLAQAVLKPILGVRYFLHQMLLVALQGRGAKAVYFAESSRGWRRRAGRGRYL